MSPRIKPVVAFSILIFLAIIVAGAFKLLGNGDDGIDLPATLGNSAAGCDYESTSKKYFGKNNEECSVIKYACDAGVQFSNECGCGCEVVANNCAGEGEKINLMPADNLGPQKCCPGLGNVADLYFNADSGKCGVGGDEQSVCVKCGDAVCGTGENKCNCPADCDSDLTECKKAGGQDKKLTECDGSVSDVCDFSGENVCYAENLKNGKCTGIFSPKVLCDVEELPESDVDIE